MLHRSRFIIKDKRKYNYVVHKQLMLHYEIFSKKFRSTWFQKLFLKIGPLQLSLKPIVEYAFHLTSLNPDVLYSHQDSGLINTLNLTWITLVEK
jgi:hypothetical protein